MKVLNFKTSNYFSSSAVLLGVILLPVGLAALFANLVLAAVVLLVSTVLLTTHYRLEIDFQKMTFYDYVSFLGFLKSGEREHFDTVHYLFIKTNRVSQTLNSRVSSMTVQKTVFDGYLKFSDEQKIHIDTRDDKDKLLKKMQPISNQLNIRIIDYTHGEPVVVYPEEEEI